MLRLLLPLCSLIVVSILPSALRAESLTVTVIDLQSESGLADAVVEILYPQEPAAESLPVQASIDQVDKEFISDVTVVPVGSRVNFPNSDDILHHVYSFSRAKSFDIPLYGAGDNLDRYEKFDKTGIVEIGCNIHDWMLAYIYVAASSSVSKSDSAGMATIEGLAPGRYQVRIWHARMGDGESHVKEVNLISGRNTEITLSLNLAPERRIRRAPSSARGRYR